MICRFSLHFLDLLNIWWLINGTITVALNVQMMMCFLFLLNISQCFLEYLTVSSFLVNFWGIYVKIQYFFREMFCDLFFLIFLKIKSCFLKKRFLMIYFRLFYKIFQCFFLCWGLTFRAVVGMLYPYKKVYINPRKYISIIVNVNLYGS